MYPRIILTVCLSLSLLFIFSNINAAPVSPEQAKQMVLGWLANEKRPLGEKFASQNDIASVEGYDVQNGHPNYYAIEFNPEGFVIAPGDDLIVPVVAFQASGNYTHDPASPLVALLIQDIRGRMLKVKSATPSSNRRGNLDRDEAGKNLNLWEKLLKIDREKSHTRSGIGSISSVYVNSLVPARWGQSTSQGLQTYNYFTPNNYVCGCVATAMAQLMRFHEHPRGSVGTASFNIEVSEVTQSRNLRGGDGAGGPYDWDSMPYVPATEAQLTAAKREAIGTLTYDAGVSVNMSYSASGSGTDTLMTASALKNTFGYTCGIKGYNSGSNFAGTRLNQMINPNLNAGYPVLLGITGPSGGHAIVCDGYGYQYSTIYHHLNMGWNGYWDIWYNLPNIDTSYTFNSVYKCVYNVFPDKSGEIISGRVTDSAGNPLAGVVVKVEPVGGGSSLSDISDANGIYGIAGLSSNMEYSIQAEKSGHAFATQTRSTGTSSDYSVQCGNVDGVNFGPGGSNPEIVPTLTEWGMIIMSAVLVGICVRRNFKISV